MAAALGIDVDDVLDLSASLNPYAPDVTQLVRRHLGALHRYPDVDQAERLLAEDLGVDQERLVLTAGGSQAIALVADHVVRGWVEDPDFSLYRRHLRVLDPSAPRWRSDPHNPSGRLAQPDDEPDDEPAGVWDEAFLPLSAGVWTRGRPGWALGSLTKTFACPGLRLGYAIAPTADDASAIRRQRPVWAVGSLACAVLPDLLEQADLPDWSRRIAVAREDTSAMLKRHGLSPLPSDAPWLLVPNTPGLRAALARQAVIVRECSSFGLCNYSRIAIPGEAGIERLESALVACVGLGERGQ